MIGQTLGHYRILQRLGEGGMGIVYKALDTKLNRQVALKLLPPELTSDAERRLRFQREAQTTAALDHPNIATIYEVGEHEGTPYLAMQLVEGITLRERIGGAPLPFREWLRVAQPIAEALAHAHARRVIHRDLKPDNVMLTSEHQVKILDFGLAKLLDPGPAPRSPRAPAAGAADPHSQMETISQELSRAGKVFGTVAYMSPEQARGESADHRSDLFSFGIMLYQMASGRLPFKGRSGVETLHAIIAEEPTPLSQAVPEIPAEAERVVRKAMEKEPERRYQDAADLAADLRNLQRDLDSGKVSTTPARTPAKGEAGTAAGAWALRTAFLGKNGPLWTIVFCLAMLIGIYLWKVTAPANERQGSAVEEPAATSASPTALSERKKIVVLPFKNLGAPEDEYFADGLTEEITSRLAAVRGLGVISRGSAVQYANTDKRTGQIAEELGVQYILEGTVRWARSAGNTAAGASRVRITPQLIRASDDTHLWADSYDRVMADIFQVQSEIAGRVIQELGVALLEPERRAVEAAPTQSPEAYQAYLRGMHHFTQPGRPPGSMRLAITMFERATQLDPGFALAHAALSRAHSNMYHEGSDRTGERLEMAKRAADRALALAPERGEVHLAVGLYHYWGHKDYERALEEFSAAEKMLPNHADLLEAIGFVRRRQGRWEESIQKLKGAIDLDPLRADTFLTLAETLLLVRRYEEAEQYLNQAIAIAPDSLDPYWLKARNYYIWKGTTADSRAVLEAMPPVGPDGGTEPLLAWVSQELYERNFRAALDRLSAIPLELYETQFSVIPKKLLEADLHRLLAEHEAARSAYAAARATLEPLVKRSPDDYRLATSRGLALAGLGSRDEAIREGKRAIDLMPISKDAFIGPVLVFNLAVIYTLVGELDAAFDPLEQILSVPSASSIPRLRLEPLLEPLQTHPRFKKLEKKYARAS